MSRLRSALSILPILALGTTLLSPTQASHPTPPNLSRDTAISLLRDGSSRMAISRDQQTGVPTFLGGELPKITADVATPVEAARAFFAEQAGLFRMRAPSQELSLVRDEHDRFGM